MWAPLSEFHTFIDILGQFYNDLITPPPFFIFWSPAHIASGIMMSNQLFHNVKSENDANKLAFLKNKEDIQKSVID